MNNKEALKLEYIRLDLLTPYAKNARKHQQDDVSAIAASIKAFGFKDPIGVWGEHNIIVEGHGRLLAARECGLDYVPCIRLDELTDEQRRAYALAHNKTAELSAWDFDSLSAELNNITAFDMGDFGFVDDMFDNDEIGKWDKNKSSGVSLMDRYIVPPFSILDSRQGYWQSRKSEWKSIINSGNGRDDELLGGGLKELAHNSGTDNLTGTSIFDPVLCEVLYRWFCPAGGAVIDPFAGGSVRGLVASMLGLNYTGIDLRPEQIEANNGNYNDIQSIKNFSGGELIRPSWIVGDSCDIDKHTKGLCFDFALTCPPYGDLEQYSDNPSDLSNMEYGAFIEAYRKIIHNTCYKLKDNSFFAIVVGDIRDKHGYYRDFIGDTKSVFREAGLHIYNDCVLVEAVATAALRAGKQFNAGRKVVKTHQNVIVFVKGDEKKIELKPYNFEETSEYAV